MALASHKKILLNLKNLSVDVITTGNHWNDQPETEKLVLSHKNLLIPANMNNALQLIKVATLPTPAQPQPLLLSTS